MAGNSSHGPGASCPAPARPEDIRNVVLVGPSGSGKSTLFEHLVAARVPGHRPREAAKGGDTRSVGLEAATVEADGKSVTLLDSPGYADFVGDVRAGLRAADAALFVLSATDGVDAATGMLWHECEAVGMPRAVVVTKLEGGRATFEETVAGCRRVFGAAQPLYLPVQGPDGTIDANLALLTRRVYDYSGGSLAYADAQGEQLDDIEAVRSELVESIITEAEDDTLLDRYLEGEDIGLDTIREGLMKAVGAGTFFPVIPLSAVTGAGVTELLEIITDAFPDPAGHPLPMVTTVDGEPLEPMIGDPSGPLCAEVVKTSTDPYVGRVSLVRVFNGTLRPDDVVHVSGHLSTFAGKEVEGHPDHDSEERVGPLSMPLPGGEHTPLRAAVAGQVVEVAKLAKAETGDTLSAKDSPVVVEPWLLPDPLLPVAIHPASKADEDKLAAALQRLVAEDVTMRLDHNPETHQTVLWTMGQAHVDLLLGRLQERYQVTVEAEPLRVALRETFVAPAKAMGRHVKQSGGHGQFAVCHLEIEPLERGAGFEFVDKVVGGAVPRQFIPSVEKGVRAQMAKGTLAGYPMVDVRVTLTDGKAHSVDSSDMAFQTAGALALKEATSSATVTLLEPVDTVDVSVADEYVGPTMSDLSTRRGRVSGTEPDGEGRTVIHAEVPALELTRYAIDLRSVSHGTGSFTRELLRYDPLPRNLAQDLVTG